MKRGFTVYKIDLSEVCACEKDGALYDELDATMYVGTSALTEAALAFYVCNGCGALAPDSRQPTTKCACGTHDWRRFTRSK